MKKIITILAIFSIFSIAHAVPISVPSSIGPNYSLISDTTGRYVATTTGYFSHIFATSTATSTFANGINLSAGCFSIGDTCIGGTSLSGGSPNTLTYWTSGTLVGATSSPTVGYITATSTTASSTFANGLNITSGCFAVNGVCVGAGSGLTEAEVNAFIHASTTIPKTYTENTFSALQTFGNASTTAVSATLLCLDTDCRTAWPVDSTASSTLLVDNNTFSGLNTFTATTTFGSLTAHSNALVVGVGEDSVNFFSNTNPFRAYGYKVFFNSGSAWNGSFYVPSPYRIFVTEIGANSSGADLTIDTHAGRDFIFKGGTGSAEEYMRLKDGGSLGIGTSSPASKLSVAGDSYLGGNVIATGTLSVTGLTTLGNASTTALSATSLCISTECKTAWPTDSTASSTLLSDNNTFSGVNTFSATTSFSGNVGIGTTDPKSKLHVYNSAPIFESAGVDGTLADVVIFATPGYPTSYRNKIRSSNSSVPSLSKLIFSLSNGESTENDTMTLLGNGYAGIGTTSPFTLFSVAGDSYLGGNVTATGTLSVAGALGLGTTTLDSTISVQADQASLSLYSTSGSAVGGKINFRDDYSGLTQANKIAASIIGQPENNGGRLMFLTTSGSTLAERMRINGDGNLGIGTTTPSSLLTVYSAVKNTPGLRFQTFDGALGNLLFVGEGDGSGGHITFGASSIGYDVTNTPSTLTSDVSYRNPGIFRYYASTDGSDNSGFYLGSASRGSEQPISWNMTVQKNGKVGIGTTTPMSKLSVAGDTYLGGNVTATGTLAVTGLTTLGNASTTALSVNGTAVQAYSYKSFSLASTTAWSGTSTARLIEIGQGEIWDSAKCATDAGTLNVDINVNGTHFMLLASTTAGTQVINRIITSGATTTVAAGTPANSPTNMVCTIKSHIDNIGW